MQEQVETLMENNEEMRLLVDGFKEYLGNTKQNFNERAMERTLAVYMEKIAGSLHKDCGERPQNSNKLREKNILGELY